MARIKGAAIRARVDYLVEHFGDEGLERVLEGLEPEQRRQVGAGILVSEWYPLELSDALLGAAEQLLGSGDGSLCRAIGHTSALSGLTSTYSVFAERLNSHEIAARMARTTSLVWKSYYDEGAFHTRATGSSEIQSELTGLPRATPWLCHVLVGYIGGHVEVLGGRDVVVTHAACRCQGQERCLWEARWS